MNDFLQDLNLDLSDSVKVASSILGYKLIHRSSEGITSGYIVETEAYSSVDPASHSYRGKTLRNSAQFEQAGTIYVYFTYGMHYCMNIVTGPVGNGQAVLIRAIEPIEGIELMKQRRHKDEIKNLTNGPAKLTQALGIDKNLNGSNILEGPITIEKGFTPKVIEISPRIGISEAKELPWRFFIKGNSFVSRV